jgi:hypothetical protein
MNTVKPLLRVTVAGRAITVDHHNIAITVITGEEEEE